MTHKCSIALIVSEHLTQNTVCWDGSSDFSCFDLDRLWRLVYGFHVVKGTVLRSAYSQWQMHFFFCLSHSIAHFLNKTHSLPYMYYIYVRIWKFWIWYSDWFWVRSTTALQTATFPYWATVPALYILNMYSKILNTWIGFEWNRIVTNYLIQDEISNIQTTLVTYYCL